MIKFQLRYAKQILIISLLLIAALATFIPQFEINPSFSALISSDTEYNTNERILSKIFPTNDRFVVFVELDETSLLQSRITSLDSPEFYDYAEQAATLFSESQYVRTVLPPEVSDDGKFARIPVLVFVPRNNDGFSFVIEDLEYYLEEAGSLPGVDVSLTGFSSLLRRINVLIIRDNIKVIGLTFIALLLGLLWYYKNWRLALITVTIPTLSLIIVASMMAILQIPLTITLAAVGIIMLGIGVDYTIHVVLHYEEYLNHGMSKRKALIESISHLWKAIVTSFVTTLAGFTALMFGISPSSQDQGIVLAIGIIAIFLTTMIVLPPMIYLFAGKKTVHENTLFKKIKKYLIRLSHYQTHDPWRVLLFIGVGTVIMFFGMTQVEFSTGNNNWIPDDDPIQEAFRASSLAFGGGGVDSLTLVLQSERGDLRNIQTVRDIDLLKTRLLSQKNVLEVSSPFDDVEYRTDDIYERAEQRSNQFSKDFTLTTISLRATDFGNGLGEVDLLDEIRDIIDRTPIHQSKISLFGDIIRFDELGQSLQADTGFTTLFSLLLVFVLAAIAYASFTIGFIALLPIIIGLIWTVGMMGFFGVPFTSLSTGLVALVLGIGVDFSVHLVNSTYNYFNKGKSLDESLRQTIMHTGTPILLSSITTFIGFMSLIIASLLGIRRLGISLGLSIVAVFIVTIIMVPAILSLQLRNKRKSIHHAK
jgi:predicted RND superfamily exporter protein